MRNEKILIRELFDILLRNKLSIFLIFFITVGFSIQLTTFMKKKFKAEFEINVYSKYFQNPLISEIIPGVYNISEMRFTIDSMVKEAINDDFIDQIATDFNIYKLDTDELTLAKNRQLLRDRFSSFSTGGQSYKVNFTHNDPYEAKKIAERTLDKVKSKFIDSRIETIEMIKQMMIKRLQAFNASQKISTSGGDQALASKSPDVLKAELKKIETNISALSKQYNSQHPKIKSLLSRKKTVESWLEEFSQSSFSTTELSTITMPTDKVLNEKITSQFYSKYHNFNMALDIEKRSLESYIGIIKRPQLPAYPIWPKKRLFAGLGFLLAMIFAFIYIFIQEIMIPSKEELIKEEADKLNAVFLGSLSLSNIKQPKKELSKSTVENKKLIEEMHLS